MNTEMTKQVDQNENHGRNHFQQWANQKGDDIQIIQFSTERKRRWDVLFLSGGTLCICDIKSRNYNKDFFDWKGAEVDFDKAKYIFDQSVEMEAIPIIFTVTNDSKYIISDLRKSRKPDVTIEERQSNNLTHFTQLKHVLNLKRCTIN
jgi:hypothetical protein